MSHAAAGRSLSTTLVAASIVAGTTLAITCSYRPIALWWVMVVCSAINLVRFGARSVDLPAARRAKALRAASILKHQFTRRRPDAAAPADTPSASKASLDRQNTRFLIWFTQHNLLWTIVGFGGSLLLWHRFGPSVPALVVMSALMSCGVFAALGALAGARTHGLGLCWREPCRTPGFRTLRGLVDDVGTVVVLRNRHEYAAGRDWAKGGRFHELFLTIDELARAGVEPGLSATLHDTGDTARRALARKERYDRALALAPVFAVSLLAALIVVPPLAGSEPLPPLWDIMTGKAGNGSPGDAASRPEDGTPRASRASPDRKNAKNEPPEGPRDPTSAARASSPSSTAAGEATPAQDAPPGSGSPSAASPGAGTAAAGDQIARAQPGNATGGAADGQAAGEGSDAGRGAGAGQNGGGGGNPGQPSNDGEAGGPGGRGGGPKGYGTDGAAPQRAESPTALPDAPTNPGKAIEVVLPPFADAKGQSPGDDPTGEKRKGTPPESALAYQPLKDGTPPPNGSTSREPVQRWPNWVFRLLHKQRN